MKRYFGFYLKILVLLTVFGLGVLGGLFYYYSDELPPLSELQRYDLKTGSRVYDRHNNLVHTFAVEKRELTDISKLPAYLVYGQVAVEDQNFFNHWGMDVWGTLRSLIIDVIHMSMKQGGSTITQQLSRNLFLSLDKEIPRKIKEIMLAAMIESRFSKLEILELYFNKVPFGPGLYGIESASRKYFNKKARDLSIKEAALLIGMPQLPSAYYPIRHPERATRRRNGVLGRLLAEKVINKQQYDEAVNSDLGLQPVTDPGDTGDYFLEYIRGTLEKKYGTQRLFAGGLEIYTTIDWDLSQYADSVLNAQLADFESKYVEEVRRYDKFDPTSSDITTPYLQGGVFVMETGTGYVRTMIGGRNFRHSKFNRMHHARRQPGSSFKPILYSTALENGYTPATVIQDQRTVFVQDDHVFYTPHNFEKGHYFGYTRMRDALKRSQNVYAVKMLFDLTPEKVVDYARRYGLMGHIMPVLSLAIGACEVRPIELISAYSTFPGGGERVTPVYIRYITDAQGNILEQNHTEHIKVIKPTTAYLMTSLMKSVIDEGTGRGVRWRGYPWNAGGKTGTTDDYRDAWFIGYNQELVVGIWTGFDDNTPMSKQGTGAVAALPSWPYIMKYAMELDAPKSASGKPLVDGNRYEFTRPAGIVETKINPRTGLLPASRYDDSMSEYFSAGSQPTPLSDSLGYNLYPTKYKPNDLDSLVIDLGGKDYPEARDSLDLSSCLLAKKRKGRLDYIDPLTWQGDAKADSTNGKTEILDRDLQR